MIQRTKIQQNRNLVEELGQRNHELETSLSLFQMVSSSLNPIKEINYSLEFISRSLKIDGSYILIFDKNQIMIDIYYGFPELVTNGLINILHNQVVINSILQQTDTIFMDNKNIANSSLFSYLAKKNYHSCASIPLFADSKLIGTIGLASVKENAFYSFKNELLPTISYEITELIQNYKQYEDILFSKTSKKLDKMRVDALAEISHELRTPLTTIKGFASSLLQTDISFDEETRTSFIQAIDTESDRLKRLIDDLLVISRIEAGMFQVKKEKHTILEIVDSVRDRLYTITPRHNLRIIVPDDSPFILADSNRIGEVITNLVDNATKYSPEDTTIILKIISTDDEVITSVIDNGIGVSSEYHQKIFERFCNIPGSHPKKSTGLGLYICHGIVHAHGGNIWVNSEPGNGSTFSFNLPVSPEK